MRNHLMWSAALVLAGISGAATAVVPAGPAAEVCAEPGVSLGGYTAPAVKSREAYGADMDRLHAWLRAEAAPLAKRSRVDVALSPQERFTIGETDACADCEALQSGERRLLVGIAKAVDYTVDLRPAGAKQPGLRQADDGGLVWTAQFHSPGATALRIAFAGLDLPIGAELYVYNDAGEAHGPYRGRGAGNSGELVSNTVSGDTAYVQLRVFGAPDPADRARLHFRIAEIGHIGPGFELARRINASRQNEKAFCDYNATCVVNGECASGWSHLGDLRRAAAHMLFRSGGFYYICSGGLLNNSRNDGTPLFLTANHCLNKQREADSLEAFFDYRASSCSNTGACDMSYAQMRSAFPTTLGATMLAAGSSGDYSLMQLSSTPAGTRHFLGWSTDPVALAGGTTMYRMSHPKGAPQSWSRHSVDADGFGCGTLPRGRYIYSADTSGATEGGSSGSPVLNASGLVVGQLYGACGSNLNDVCDTVRNLTVDGALAGYFANVAAYLDPEGNGGGGDGTVASVQSVSISKTTKGPWTHYSATVVVGDQNGNPVANATVSGTWSGALSGSASGSTDGSGSATITDRTRNPGSVTFCVTSVAGSGISFDGNEVCGSGS
jgi:V8-like Glu-specific endopeptidase